MSSDPAIHAPAPPPNDAFATRAIVRRLLRTALALLLGGIAVFGAIALVRQGLVPLVDALFHPGPAVLSIVRRIGIFIAVLTGYAAWVQLSEHRAVRELHLRPLRALSGGAAGVLMIGLPIAALFALGAYQLVLFRGLSSSLWGVAALILIAATIEELVYRAVLFRVLERAAGTAFALVAQALVFALVHLGNLVDGSALDVATLLAAGIVLGLLWGGIFVLSRNLWVGVGHHALWNFTILLSGVPLSGIDEWRALSPLESRYAGPAWLTGGQFGPESSLLVLATTTLALAWLLRFARRRGSFRRGEA